MLTVRKDRTTRRSDVSGPLPNGEHTPYPSIALTWFVRQVSACYPLYSGYDIFLRKIALCSWSSIVPLVTHKSCFPLADISLGKPCRTKSRDHTKSFSGRCFRACSIFNFILGIIARLNNMTYSKGSISSTYHDVICINLYNGKL